MVDKSNMIAGLKSVGLQVAAAIFFAVLIMDVHDLPARAALFPRFLGWLGLLFCVISIATTLHARKWLEPVQEDGEPLDREGYAVAARYLGWIVIYIAGTWVIGQLPLIIVFSICFLRIEARLPWLKILPLTLSLVGFMWLLDIAAKINLPTGIISAFF